MPWVEVIQVSLSLIRSGAMNWSLNRSVKSILALPIEFAGEDDLSSTCVEPSKMNGVFLIETQAKFNSLGWPAIIAGQILIACSIRVACMYLGFLVRINSLFRVLSSLSSLKSDSRVNFLQHGALTPRRNRINDLNGIGCHQRGIVLVYQPSKAQLKKEVPELVDSVSRLLQDFQKETGADDRFVHMILGGLMNDYRFKEEPISKAFR